MIAWVDLAAGKVAYRFVHGSGADAVVTRVIQQVEFKDPVYLGEWVNFISTVVKAGKSSVTVKVEVFAEDRDTKQRLACIATVIMVAVKKDAEGKYIKYIHGKKCD